MQVDKPNQIWNIFKSIFFFWKTDFWVTLGDFTVKTQNWEGASVINWKSIK